jgi:demethylmenaquinone methyltransferase/2-methoxy-6-polyprenyl-1,4-benzoquinol methylase
MSVEDTDKEGRQRAAVAAFEERPDKRPETIADMFDAIARRYDLLNHLLSGGMDLYWRARAVRSLGFTGREVVLDLCTGTCDLAIAALRRRQSRAARVIGLDFSTEMLRIGQRKLRASGLGAAASLVRGDAMALPVASSSVDAVTIAFGIRNVLAPEVACAEIGRVLRPGGRLAVLEFSFPRLAAVRAVYTWYFRNVLPAIGRAVSRHDHAYAYLPESVGTFLPPERFSALVRRAGLAEVRSVPLTFGIVYLYTAVKPAAASG